MDKKSKLQAVRRTLTGGVFAAALTFGTSGASAEEILPTVYHIYMNGKMIGTVDNKELIEKVSQETIKKKQDEFKGLPLTISNMEIVPEQMFRPQANNGEAVKQMEKEMDVAINSTAIFADGKPVVFFKSKEDAEEALKQYKLRFTTEDKLQAYEENKDNQKSLPELKKDESRITVLKLSDGVKLSEVKAKPEAIMTVSQALDVLGKGTDKEGKYEVKEADDLGKIASDFSMTLDQLKELNPSLKENESIKPGETLTIAEKKPYFNVLIKEERLKQESIPFKTEKIDDASRKIGDESIKQKGEEGEADRGYQISTENGQIISQEMTKEQKVKDPVKEIVMKGTKKESSVGDGSLEWPAMGGVITSKMGYRWGKLHKGIDISGVTDKTIKAADNGKVVFAGVSHGYGNKVEIDHGNGTKTVYGHLSSISVSKGDTIGKGDKIGVMGSTGHSTGLHLHFEVYKNGNLKNPLNYLKR
ncbi:peptidoglycan DD-metalloendopeptidase family protein [Metabacillus sp. RGM 3146]|uniref:peptidoglycan DD-metalloendopeptidase family protein n=1 Tax=Metabacillus sp. RGM 3146 TaxID=3401092 RepID=UPI003B9984D7